MIPQRGTLTAALAILALTLLAEAATGDRYALVRQLTSTQPAERSEAARKLLKAPDPSLVPALVDTLFFTPKLARTEILEVLKKLTGEDAGTGYHDWVELVGRRTDLAPGPGYMEYKLSLLSRIDPRYQKVFFPGAPARIRLEEIVWGGAKLDGIPALEDPPHIPASEARSLSDDEKVFGVSAGGEHRAYPLRYLSWHEMVNDVLGSEPVTVSFCTLCNSGIAYSGRTPSGERRTFGTSGLLYRSNKLMYDRKTFTLWSNLTGEPVVGSLAREPVPLAVLPVVVTGWGAWRAAHPSTTVVKLDDSQGRRWNYAYVPGAADRNRAGVSFPIWQKSSALEPKTEVYALREGNRAKAYPIDRILAERVVNDRLGETDVVLIGDSESGAVRSYRRNGRKFTLGEGRALRDESGRRWQITEEALVAEPAGDGTSLRLERLPGHVSLWFAWFGFFPQTEVYGPRPLP